MSFYDYTFGLCIPPQKAVLTWMWWYDILPVEGGQAEHV